MLASFRVFLCSAVLSCVPLDAITITKLGTYDSGIFDESAAEIVAHDPKTQRLFVTNAEDSAVDILDFSDPSSLTKITSISIPFGGPNSVAISPDGSLVAVATAAATRTDPGTVEFYDIFGNSLGSTAVGALPDMLTFTPEGKHLLVANEGEPNDAYDNDPEGSVSIIDVSSGLVSSFTVQTATFNSFDAGAPPADVRIFGLGATFSQDVEPEYIVVSKDSATAYVALQENNAIAVVDIATATVTDVVGLGCKDHSVAGNELDASDRDSGINIQNWPVCGFYQPDSMAAFEVDGNLYIATANEGDARDYDGFGEEDRVKDLVLDPTVFPNAATLQEDENLGRLTITLADGDSDADGDFDTIYSFGARSFSIWKASDLSLVYDSGSEFEDKTAELLPALFNANSDEDEIDNRSDNKGPEPEAIATGMLEGVLHAFIGLERIGGIMVRE